MKFSHTVDYQIYKTNYNICWK